jgi:NADPH:quinone reductase-like Zn-dependent oxidoreductase
VRKVVIHRPGGYERLTLETCPDPVPRPGELLVRAESIGVNYADCIVRMGLYESAKKYVGWPITPGFELAGVVQAVGDGIDDIAPGARVFAVTRFGGNATHVVVPRHHVFPLPAGFSIDEAAAFPTVFLTAYWALAELAHPRRGATLLVHSAAGGVGSALLQIGKSLGCTMVGVVGASSKVDVARRFGADFVIDKSQGDLWREAARISPRGYDVILDANGVSTLRMSYRHLASPGKLVIYGFHSMLPRADEDGAPGRVRWGKLSLDYLRTPRFNPLSLTSENKSILAFNLSYLFERSDLLSEAMGALLRGVAEGTLKPLPITRFALDDVRGAHRALESGQTVGKVVLVP